MQSPRQSGASQNYLAPQRKSHRQQRIHFNPGVFAFARHRRLTFKISIARALPLRQTVSEFKKKKKVSPTEREKGSEKYSGCLNFTFLFARESVTIFLFYFDKDRFESRYGGTFKALS